MLSAELKHAVGRDKLSGLVFNEPQGLAASYRRDPDPRSRAPKRGEGVLRQVHELADLLGMQAAVGLRRHSGFMPNDESGSPEGVALSCEDPARRRPTGAGAVAKSDVDENASPRQRLEAVVERMRIVDDAFEYYAFTLTADLQGNPVFEYQSQWVGQGSKRMRELRAASLVHPHNMRHLWTEIGQASVVVTDAETMAVYLRIGGNALIADDVAKQYLPDLLEPRECVPSPLGQGPRSLSQVPQSALNHAPTQKLRTDVLRRDGFRCQGCGRRPADHVDITLHVHHVRPYGDGGLTEASNLLTLCSTCHQGLKPDFDMTLLELTPGALADEDALGELAQDDGAKFREGVRRYRDKIAALEAKRAQAPKKPKKSSTTH